MNIDPLKWKTSLPIKKVGNVDEVIEIEKQLGKGSFGTVHLAAIKNKNSNKTVAVKTIDLNSIKVKEASLKQEIEALHQARDCQGLPRLYDVIYNSVDHTLHLVLEYISGMNMFAYIYGRSRKNKHTNPVTHESETIIHVVHTLTQGLKCLHKIGIAHRDIKLANIMIDPTTNDAKWIDLGLAITETEQHSSKSRILGTATTMAPEVVANMVENWRATDVWSFGCVIHEIVMQKIYSIQQKVVQLRTEYKDDRISIECVRHHVNVLLNKKNSTRLPTAFKSFPVLKKTTLKCLIIDPKKRWKKWYIEDC